MPCDPFTYSPIHRYFINTSITFSKSAQVFKRIVRLVTLQFFNAGVAGGNGNRCHAVGFAAFHIVGRIADDHDILPAEGYAAVSRCTIDRDTHQLGAHTGVAAESAEGEIVPEACKLKLSPAGVFEVAGEYGAVHLRHLLKFGDKRDNARIDGYLIGIPVGIVIKVCAVLLNRHFVAGPDGLSSKPCSVSTSSNICGSVFPA